MSLPDTFMEFLANSLLELVTQTATNLPPDVRQAMSVAATTEAPGTQASQALDIILSNVDMAVEDEGPICQDTGMPTFFVHTPVGVNQIKLAKAIRESARASPPMFTSKMTTSPASSAKSAART